MVDSGLLTYLLHANQERLLTDSRFTGSIFENFVISEILKQATWSTKSVRLYHFRTAKGAEVDIVLEDASGSIAGIEIKYSETVSPNDFKGLYELQIEARDKFVKGVVFYTGQETIPFAKNMFAVPIDALWML